MLNASDVKKSKAIDRKMLLDLMGFDVVSRRILDKFSFMLYLCREILIDGKTFFFVILRAFFFVIGP